MSHHIEQLVFDDDEDDSILSGRFDGRIRRKFDTGF